MRDNEKLLQRIINSLRNGLDVTATKRKGFGGLGVTAKIMRVIDHVSTFDRNHISRSFLLEYENKELLSLDVNFMDDYDFTIYGLKQELLENKKEEKSGDKMKENNDQSKFKELCDTAYKSAVNGDIIISHLSDDAIEFRCGSGNDEFYLTSSSDCCDIQDGINAINNLYYEEFFVDDKQDLLNIKEEDTGTLANGVEFHVNGITGDQEDKSILIIFKTGNFVWATIEILKGATIKQKKVD